MVVKAGANLHKAKFTVSREVIVFFSDRDHYLVQPWSSNNGTAKGNTRGETHLCRWVGEGERKRVENYVISRGEWWVMTG